MSDQPETSDRTLDGNAAAGPLAEIFTVELTAAVAHCANCGHSAPLASYVLYADAPALVIRCPTCQEVVLRYGQIGNRMRLDLIGITSLVVDLGET
jgi:NAD-dependent SIR2 family protein deacetylase